MTTTQHIIPDLHVGQEITLRYARGYVPETDETVRVRVVGEIDADGFDVVRVAGPADETWSVMTAEIARGIVEVLA